MKTLFDARIKDAEKQFSKNLKEVVTTLGLNQAALAVRIGLTQAALSQLINGKRAPSFSTIIRILDAVPVTFERLLK